MALGNVLVTGGTGDLGRAIVEALCREEASVAFTFYQAAHAATRIAGETGARPYELDLAHPKAPEHVVARIEEDLGSLDGLVNNAGVRMDGLLAMTSDENWRRVIDLNLGGLFRVCRAVLPGMIHRRRGAIVNIASLSAFHGLPGQTSYAASKAGIVGLTRSLAREVGGRCIRVNAVAPGFLPTEMTRNLPDAVVNMLRGSECLSNGVDIQSVAQTVVFLLSPRAASITGQCLIVDAGASA